LLNYSKGTSLEVWLRYADDLGLGPYYHDRRSPQRSQPVARESPLESSATFQAAATQTESARTQVAPITMPNKNQASAASVAAPKPPAPPPLIQVPAADSLFEERVENDSLPAILEAIGHNCTRCKLHKGRTKLVFGVGNPKAELVFIGEGPGRDEDLQGEPFVGRAGKLLTQMIEAMSLKRDDVYICNVVKCRPPENRLPEKDEITTCSPFLMRQLDVIGPKVICALGSCAAQTLLQTTQGISRFRGEWFDFRGAKLIATYHPAYLLRNPAAKGEVWKDLQKVMAHLGLQAKRKQAGASS
jgi:uracil-DNA glycosylase